MKPDLYLKTKKTQNQLEWLRKQIHIYLQKMNSSPTVLSAKDVNQLFSLGAIYINGKRVFTPIQLGPDQTLRVFPRPFRFPTHLLTKEHLLFENESYVAMDKPAGIPSVPVASNGLENCLVRTRQLLGIECLYPAHRLDKATRGVLLMAKFPEAVHKFQKLQRARKVLKLYKVLTQHPVPLGLHEHMMIKGQGKMQIVSDHPNPIINELKLQSRKNSPPETSTYLSAQLRVLDSHPMASHWVSTIQLITGRTHQIRCQLAHLGCPIVGDPLYGHCTDGGLRLWAWKLEFDDMAIESQRPRNEFV